MVTARQILLHNEQEPAVIQGQRLVTSVLFVKAPGSAAIHVRAHATNAVSA
ncbi:MAG TPA: hypothetical protein VMK12_29110 [Anaeromyxobacteraceae bacterium]|nr:hypothetical protein [Anaeromyxobacteraceae bacterium]